MIVFVVMLVTVFVTVFVTVLVTVFITVFVTVFVTVVLAIVRDVSIGVPVMPDEIDRLTAGIVLAAVMAPVALIARAHMEIDRRRQYAAMNSYTHDGRTIDEAGRRRVADIHASIKARVAQADGGPHLCERCAADYHRREASSEK